jgi:hypothetical protein
MYVGTYSGTWITTDIDDQPLTPTPTNNGTWMLVVDTYGISNGSFASADGSVSETLFGSTVSNGYIIALGSGSISFMGQISGDGISVEGDWIFSDLFDMATGTFTGTK